MRRISERQLQLAFWSLGLCLYAAVAIAPRPFFRRLGRGRVSPSDRTLGILRALAAVCVLGAVYQLVRLART